MIKKIEVSRGNAKLPRTTAILNITPALTCPSRAMGVCQLDKCGVGSHKCYAAKAERAWPEVLPYRVRQQEWWDQDEATLCLGFKGWYDNLRNKVSAVRIGESGDFRNAEDVGKLRCLAECNKSLTWYCYTARQDLFTPKVLEALPANVTVNGSGWMAHNNFVVLGPRNRDTQAFDHMCPGDCRDCSMCLVPSGKTIGVKPH